MANIMMAMGEKCLVQAQLLQDRFEPCKSGENRYNSVANASPFCQLAMSGNVVLRKWSNPA